MRIKFGVNATYFSEKLCFLHYILPAGLIEQDTCVLLLLFLLDKTLEDLGNTKSKEANTLSSVKGDETTSGDGKVVAGKLY